MVFHEETFFADMAMIGAARHHRGSIFTGTTEIGRRTFIGNAAQVIPGTKIRDKVLIGVLSLPPEDHEKIVSGSNWLGSPAIYLPRREVKKFGEETTYRPPFWLVVLRYLVEFLRIVMPSVLLATTGMASILVASRLEKVEWLSVWALGSIYPALYLLFAIGMFLVIVLMKWIIIGRYQKHVAPLWSIFVRRSEFITALYEDAAVRGLVGVFLGTPFVAPILRLLGCHIGARVYLGTSYITEFDLVHVGDDAAVNSLVSLQTHLFEDRVMKMDVIDVGDRVSIGPRAVVLYGCHVEKGAEIDGLSLVMKGECIPPNTQWRGIPCTFTSSYKPRVEEGFKKTKQQRRRGTCVPADSSHHVTMGLVTTTSEESETDSEDDSVWDTASEENETDVEEGSVWDRSMNQQIGIDIEEGLVWETTTSKESEIDIEEGSVESLWA